MDRRKLKRRHLIYYLRVFDTTTGMLLGHLVDITYEGLKLVSEEPVKENVVYQMHMELPEEYDGKSIVNFTATALHCVKDINPMFYATGFQMQEVLPEHVDIINRLVSEFGFND